MFPKTLTLTVTSAAEETAVELALAAAREVAALAGAAPAGTLLDACEAAAVAQGRDWSRQLLAQTLSQRLAEAQQRGRRCAPAHAATPANTKALANATS